MNTPRLVLASASPARRTLLTAAGIAFEPIVSGVDESAVREDDPATLSLTLAKLKARAVADRLTGDRLVIGCDSLLEFEGEGLGKPASADEAVARWRRMRGRPGVLHTGHCLIDLGTGKQAEAVASTVVHFADLSDQEIEAYVGTGEPLHVAGGFTIDGRGAPFVLRIEGDHGTVVGLSLPLLRELLASLDVPLSTLWEA